jgi:hypothetical protein
MLNPRHVPSPKTSADFAASTIIATGTAEHPTSAESQAPAGSTVGGGRTVGGRGGGSGGGGGGCAGNHGTWYWFFVMDTRHWALHTVVDNVPEGEHRPDRWRGPWWILFQVGLRSLTWLHHSQAVLNLTTPFLCLFIYLTPRYP